MDVINKKNALHLKIADTEIEITAGEKTDYFIDPNMKFQENNAPFVHSNIEGDFILKAIIKPQFLNTYDAGALFIYETNTKWIKFAFKLTDLGFTSLVSVVTHDVSDDSNHIKIEEESIWMQIVRQDNLWCLHYSKDGENWKMARYFGLNMNKKVKIGFEAQSPLGDRCAVSFSNIQISKNKYIDIRKATI